jgi:hypothetical protein
MQYILPYALIPTLNDLNKSLGKYAGASGTDDANFALLDIPDEWLPDYQNFITTHNLQPSGYYNEQRGGKLIVNDILEQLKALTDAEKGQIFNTITPVLITLLAGNLRAAKYIADNIPTTTVYTAQRKTWLVNRIQTEIHKL